jgi:predicted nucleic acid-binding protein
MGGPRVYSEDLNAGPVYDGVTVVNPFAASGSGKADSQD